MQTPYSGVCRLTPLAVSKSIMGQNSLAMGRRVLIVDDHKSVAEAVAQLLGGVGWGPITAATSASEALAALDRVRPDVVIVDLRLGDSDGIQVLEGIRGRRNPPAALVLTAMGSVQDAVASVRAGARGFVPKGARPHELVQAVAAVAAGGGWMPPNLLGPVFTELLEPAPPTEWQSLVASLTAREREVLELMVAGYDRPAIARRLMISLNTARTHTKNILSKLGVHSSLEAVSVALRAGLRPDEVA